ncbi:hypothetical protein FQA39_LY00104 [Lamprigera yunnana]|nr:hypothetical protein FQA39_LY00104 [Lamprigera yunnana]
MSSSNFSHTERKSKSPHHYKKLEADDLIKPKVSNETPHSRNVSEADKHSCRNCHPPVGSNNINFKLYSEERLIPYIIIGSTIGVLLASIIVWVIVLGFHCTITPKTKPSYVSTFTTHFINIFKHATKCLNSMWNKICKCVSSKLNTFTHSYDLEMFW